MPTVAISLLGTVLDRRGRATKRWDKWRPTVSLCQQHDLIIDRLELMFDPLNQNLADEVTSDIRAVSPETEVRHHHLALTDPWDFGNVYAELLDFSRRYNFDANREKYLIHITTGTHVAQICLYLLTEARYLPGQLIQTSPAPQDNNKTGDYQIIDLDLSKYDQITSRFAKEHEEGTAYLKGGIETQSPSFNKMIEQLEQVSLRSSEPILLLGPTGAGKSQLARRVYHLRKQRGRIRGDLVTVNCATLRGENAMSALFGHRKGAFTGAVADRPGLLRQADGGLLFLDEIGELGLDEQAMLLRAVEEKLFMPVGADKDVSSDFQLIAGTNRDLNRCAAEGSFREDLLARIDLWTYALPSLKERIEDLAPNIDYELEAYSRKSNSLISFNKPARERYLTFGRSPSAFWTSNFRDLNASIIRMATLAEGGRITVEIVEAEIERLEKKWQTHTPKNRSQDEVRLADYLPAEILAEMDHLDKVKLAEVIRICRSSNSMADAGRRLFDKSRGSKDSSNDSHRVRQILAKHGLTFNALKSAE